MKVRMLMDRKGSPDGVTTVYYRTGEVYDLPPSLAEPWLRKGYCEQDKVLELETKAGPAPEPQPEPPAQRRKGKR